MITNLIQNIRTNIGTSDNKTFIRQNKWTCIHHPRIKVMTDRMAMWNKWVEWVVGTSLSHAIHRLCYFYKQCVLFHHILHYHICQFQFEVGQHHTYTHLQELRWVVLHTDLSTYAKNNPSLHYCSFYKIVHKHI